jgi:hypothetical protein
MNPRAAWILIGAVVLVPLLNDVRMVPLTRRATLAHALIDIRAASADSVAVGVTSSDK